MECLGKYYAGIGSRETPKVICDEMERIAKFLSERDYTVRTGDARGADAAFVSGAEKADIWIPGYKLPGYKSCTPTKPSHNVKDVSSHDDHEAFKSVRMYHPVPHLLIPLTTAIHARNYRQVVGRGEPNSEFVLCWTEDGKDTGGTGQAIRIAWNLGIPVFNLFFEEHLTALYSALTLRDIFL